MFGGSFHLTHQKFVKLSGDLKSGSPLTGAALHLQRFGAADPGDPSAAAEAAPHGQRLDEDSAR